MLEISQIFRQFPKSQEEDFLYQIPRLTQEKRSRVRLLAKRRTGKKVASAEPPLAVRPALDGSGLKARNVKTDIARQAAAQAEAISQAIIQQRQSGQDSGAVIAQAGFDPTRPLSADWQRVLEKVAARLAQTLAPAAKPLTGD